ncbi:MAG: hypothetical protein ACREET_15585 [Stellaceae bacterium]
MFRIAAGLAVIAAGIYIVVWWPLPPQFDNAHGSMMAVVPGVLLAFAGCRMVRRGWRARRRP